jgi:hypothetical protein
MTTKSDDSDRAARKARADAIRRARDKRNASVAAPTEPSPGNDPATPTPDRGPNYVDFVDRKMRRRK